MNSKIQIKRRVSCLLISLVASQVHAAGTCDSDRGARLFAKCAICHSKDEAAPGGAGPNLYHVIGRKIAAQEGFPYSEAMEQREGVWSVEALDRFIASPMTDMPGTMMAFAGFKKEQDRRDLICFLQP